MSYDSLGTRMKGYESVSRFYLTKRTPVVIRIDGKSFHTFTRGFERPFDRYLMQTMRETAKYLCENIGGCKLAYTQSDEISLLLVDYDTVDMQPWFDNNLQKLVSITASMATFAFNKFFGEGLKSLKCRDGEQLSEDRVKHYDCLTKAAAKGALFDSRAFTLPKEEVCNYFIWRQQDATRNSISMVAQAFFSHKQLQGKKRDEMQDMLFTEHGINWNDYSPSEKRGTCIVKQAYDKNGTTRYRWVVDEDTPIFTQDRAYIESLVK